MENLFRQPSLNHSVKQMKHLLKLLLVTITKWSEDNTLAAILGSIAHELTHYFQWISDSRLTDIGIERQASHYKKNTKRVCAN